MAASDRYRSQSRKLGVPMLKSKDETQSELDVSKMIKIQSLSPLTCFLY